MRLRVYYQNSRGLRTKTHLFHENLLRENYDIIVLTETWLNDDIYDYELFDERYTVFRKDRSAEESGKQRGGGVSIAVLKKYRATILNVITKLETIFVEVNIYGAKLIFNSCYISPNSSVKCYQEYVELFTSIDKNISLNASLILFGDFNIPQINGTSFNFNTCDKKIIKLISGLIELYNLKSFNNCLNEDGRTLDLVLGSTEVFVEEESVPLSGIDKKHPALIAEIDIKKLNYEDRNTCNLENKYNYKKANFDLLYELLRCCNWNDLNLYENVDNMVEHFYMQFYDILDICVPKYKKYTKPFYKISTLVHPRNKK